MDGFVEKKYGYDEVKMVKKLLLKYWKSGKTKYFRKFRENMNTHFV